MYTPREKIWFLALLALLAMPSIAHAADCNSAGDKFNDDIDKYKNLRDAADPSTDEYKSDDRAVANYGDKKLQAIQDCEAKAESDKAKQAKVDKDYAACAEKHAAYPAAYTWDKSKNKCINNADEASSKSLPDNDDCSAASVFAGDLKGQNCKKAQAVVKDAASRTSAVTDATTAATSAYSSLQASGATGNQDDAQTRQANIYKTLAFSKFATGLLNIVSAGQLRSAASDASSASSTITSAQQNLQAECATKGDDEACFYQNAAKYGIPKDELNYASFERMKRGAQQSQDQADAANALAKTSMITGAADMLTGMQALQAAQAANNNAAALQPMPTLAPSAVPVTRFGDSMGGPSAPGLEQAASNVPVDYGNPKNDVGNFGNARHGEMAGGMMGGKMGAPNGFKAATSGVSGGGGGGVSAGGGSLRPGGAGGPRPKAGARNTTSGEFNLAGGGPKGSGGGGAEKADANNPLADMLAKMFPTDPSGKTVVDARQIASSNGGLPEEAEQNDVPAPADLTIFEQISAKYHQLNGDGRF